MSVLPYPSCTCETVTALNDGTCGVCGNYWRIPREAKTLTIREHFAAMMLQALVAGRSNSVETGEEGMWAASAVSIADALLEELAKVRP